MVITIGPFYLESIGIKSDELSVYDKLILTYFAELNYILNGKNVLKDSNAFNLLGHLQVWKLQANVNSIPENDPGG